MVGKDKNSSSRCRVCGNAIPAERDTHGPFCSERCRLNDLSKWFGENYRIASSPAQTDEGVGDVEDE